MSDLTRSSSAAHLTNCCFVSRIVNALELNDHLDKQAKTLSVGLKRKVRAALKTLFSY